MRHAPLSLLIVAGLLAACATPEERCRRAATAELRTVERLIATTEGNIARGYALEPSPAPRAVLVPCLRTDLGGDLVSGFCVQQEIVMTPRPVAIDRRAEAGKLETLRARRAELMPGTRAALAACGA